MQHSDKAEQIDCHKFTRFADDGDMDLAEAPMVCADFVERLVSTGEGGLEERGCWQACCCASVEAGALKS